MSAVSELSCKEY